MISCLAFKLCAITVCCVTASRPCGGSMYQVKALHTFPMCRVCYGRGILMQPGLLAIWPRYEDRWIPRALVCVVSQELSASFALRRFLFVLVVLRHTSVILHSSILLSDSVRRLRCILSL
ncbi:hypothetical protein B0H21DRAFT_77527 [Amylocystis lapponica]|nr:hypothetical protein B0H21DRAFT_77527 [Amylocystis lapponica]